VLGDVGERLGDDEVGGRFHHWSGPAVDAGVDDDRHRRATRESVNGRGQPPIGEDRRGDSARQVAQLGDRTGRIEPRLANELGDLRLVVEALLGSPQLHGEPDESRRRSVVQVALEAAAAPRPGHRVRAAGARELFDALGQLALAQPTVARRGRLSAGP
jgi:hypothetical protein